MTLSLMFILFLAGLASGIVNAVAGGGTFLTFGALSLAGIPPIGANATSSIAQFPGYITSTMAYWNDIKAMWREAILLSIISALGALGGSLLLLSLDNPSFQSMVPWLLLGATALFAAGPWLKPKPGAHAAVGHIPGAIVQFVTSIYGGFFGAGMGVMMLATLGLTRRDGYHRLNALKNMLSIVIAAVAIVVFVSGGVVAWPEVFVMIPGVALGGYCGVWVAKRVPQNAVRAFVVAIGLLLAFYYFTKA